MWVHWYLDSPPPNKYAVSTLYSWVSHTHIQPTTDWNFHSQSVKSTLAKPLDPEGWLYYIILVRDFSIMGFPWGSTCNAEDLGSIPGLWRSPGEGKGYPLQYSGLENSVDYIVHGVTESWTWLSNFHFHFLSVQFSCSIVSSSLWRHELPITNSQSSPKPISFESMMPPNHLILCRPLLLLPSIFPSIRVFSNELALCIRWPKYWSFSFNISPTNEHPGLISFRMDWIDLLAVQGTLKSLLHTTVQKHQFFGTQLVL